MTTLQEENLKMLQELFPGQIRISIPQFAKVSMISTSTVYRRVSEGYGLPDYQRIGSKTNSKIVFNLSDVAKFLSQTIKTA